MAVSRRRWGSSGLLPKGWPSQWFWFPKLAVILNGNSNPVNIPLSSSLPRTKDIVDRDKGEVSISIPTCIRQILTIQCVRHTATRTQNHGSLVSSHLWWGLKQSYIKCKRWIRWIPHSSGTGLHYSPILKLLLCVENEQKPLADLRAVWAPWGQWETPDEKKGTREAPILKVHVAVAEYLGW